MTEDKKRTNSRARQRRARQRRNRRILTTVCLMALVMVFTIGGTIAWLTAETDPVTNTFTVGDINITLTESENLDLKMVPGKTITKDPKVTVQANSEACWLFVKVEKTNNPDSYLDYTIADGWTQLTNVDGVYWREVSATTNEAAEFAVLKYGDQENRVHVKDAVTKEMMATAKTNQPTLTFTAYACQQEGVASAADAWSKVNPTP